MRDLHRCLTQAANRKAQGMLITLSGLDGAGKSTLIASLRTALEERQRPVAVLHLDDEVGVYAYARMVRDRLKGPMKPAGAPSNGDRTPANPGATSPGRIILRRAWDAIVWSKVLRRLIYPVDLLLFLCYRAYIEGIRKRVLIMDRYFYDTLVDVADGRGWGWIRFLKLITPTPTLPVLVDAGPEQSYARKGEYSVEYLRGRWTAYQTVFPWVRAAVRLRNDDLAAAQAALRTVALERLDAA